MRSYRNLISSLPSKTVVFAFGRFNPPTTGHQLLVNAVIKYAKQYSADHIIYASHSQDPKKNPLAQDRKLHYLKLMFPDVIFKGSGHNERTLIEVTKSLNSRYNKIILVGGSDRVREFKTLLDRYNGKEFNFSDIKVLSAGKRDPDSDTTSGMSASKMRNFALEGNFKQFRKGVPRIMRDIDARRMMNDVRQGMNLPPLKEEVNIPTNELREQYVKGKIYNIGESVTDINSLQLLEIVKRGANHLLCKDEKGDLVTKWLHEVSYKS